MVLLVRVANTGLLCSVMRVCASVQEEPSEEDTDIKRIESWTVPTGDRSRITWVKGQTHNH